MAPHGTLDIFCMNAYDANHLRLLTLIQARHWSKIREADIYELQVLITCKYVNMSNTVGGTPTMELNPEGRHYLLRLSELQLHKAELEALKAG